MIDLTVITVTIPERAQMLAEVAECLDAQTEQVEWLVAVDEQGDGPVPYLNDLVDKTDTEWVFRLDDDDLIDPNHFATLAPYLTDEYDIVYTWPRVVPPPPPPLDGGWLQMVFPLSTLEERNFIASAAAVRTSFWCQLGGVRDVTDEDWDLWLRAWRAGARWRCVPKVTWTYRMGSWPHRSDRPEVTE